MDVSSQRSGTSNPLSQLKSMVDSWTTKRNNNLDSTSIFDENIGEDGLSIQSAYDVNIDNPYHTGSLAPNCELLDSPSLSDDELKASYTILTKGINELRVQLSTNKTLLSVNKKGRTFNTNIAEVLAANITLSINDIELHEWAVNNKFARCWYCQDLCNCSVLKVAINKAIHKSPHDVQQRQFFCDEDDGQQIQFLGFVSSHRTSNVLKYFHIHSFAVFYTNKQSCTIVRCILTSRVHILSNVQDPVLQLMLMIQFWSNGNFGTAITNNFTGHDIVLDKNTSEWLWVDGIWYYHIDPRHRTRFIHHQTPSSYSVGTILFVIHGQNMVIIYYQQQSVWCKPMCANNVFKVTFSRRFFSIGHMLANFHLSHAWCKSTIISLTY